MSLNYTAAPSSRITKRKLQRNPSSDSPSPFSSHSRKKLSASPAKRAAGGEGVGAELQHGRLEDNGLVPSLSDEQTFRGVQDLVNYIHLRTFTPIPDKSAGLSSTRIAEVLNYRAKLPPIVSVAHIQALSASPTSTEREMASLCTKGVIRRIHIPHLGKGRSVAGEGIVLVSQWETILDHHPDVAVESKEKYKELMRQHPTALSIPATSFTSAEAIALTQAGFLTTSSAAPGTADRFLSGAAANSANGSLTTTKIAQAASGTLGAIGGSDAFFGSGGGSSSKSRSGILATGSVNFALPNTGPYLRLLLDARAHLVSLLSKISPRYREAPMDLLRERWDGGVATGVKGEDARKIRGDKRGEVLPGKTRKWRQFNGLEYRWVLEECVGSGLVELFGTGTVGTGVRAS